MVSTQENWSGIAWRFPGHCWASGAKSSLLEESMSLLLASLRKKRRVVTIENVDFTVYCQISYKLCQFSLTFFTDFAELQLCQLSLILCHCIIYFFSNIAVFIGPESDHWLPLSQTHSLWLWLLFGHSVKFLYRLWALGLVKILMFKLRRDLKLKIGQYIAADAWLRLRSLI